MDGHHRNGHAVAASAWLFSWMRQESFLRNQANCIPATTSPPPPLRSHNWWRPWRTPASENCCSSTSGSVQERQAPLATHQFAFRNIMHASPVYPVLGTILLDADIARQIAARHVLPFRTAKTGLEQIHRHILRKLLDHRPTMDKECRELALTLFGVTHAGEEFMSSHQRPCGCCLGQHLL